ncbi:MAG: hypothetical protein QXZ44_06610 [Ferroplasma sp.]
MDNIRSWRKNLDYSTLILLLILLEFIISVVMLSIGYRTGKAYFRGVGVGLVIAWVTSGVAYFIIRKLKSN